MKWSDACLKMHLRLRLQFKRKLDGGMAVVRILPVLLSLSWPIVAVAKPAQVIVIRHAESAAEGPNLSQRGRERAAALVPYFLGRTEVLEFKTPVAIYAQKSTQKRPSLRPVQTVESLAAALKQPVIQFPHHEFEKMVAEINAKAEYDGKLVLICWEHLAILDIAKAFNVKDAPSKWKGSVFDRSWSFTFQSDGKISFRNLPQRLLFGDAVE